MAERAAFLGAFAVWLELKHGLNKLRSFKDRSICMNSFSSGKGEVDISAISESNRLRS